MTPINLRQIFRAWNPNPSTHTKDYYRRLFKQILPDSFSSNLTPSDCYKYPKQTCRDLTESLYNVNFDKLLSASRRRKNNSSDSLYYYPASEFTQQLLEQLMSSEPIVYLNPDHPKLTAKESMLENIKKQLEILPIDGIRKLNITHETVYQDMCLAQKIMFLLESEEKEQLTYALFLLILTALYQDRMHSYFASFYEEDASSQLAITHMESRTNFSSNANFFSLPSSSDYEYFVDPHYMLHHYYLYAFTNSYPDQLYVGGKLYITLSDDTPQATFGFHWNNRNPINEGELNDRTFQGIPILYRESKLVQIAAVDKHANFCVLFFHYDNFANSNMFERMAWMVSCNAQSQTPTFKRVLISSSAIPENALPYVRGILSTTQNDIRITPKQLKLFLELFQNQPWMPTFQTHFLPFIQMHEETQYVFSENEILSFTCGDMKQSDKLKVMYGLKACSDNAEHVLKLKTPDQFHVLIRELLSET